MGKLKIIKSRIYSWESLQRQLALWKFQDKKIVFTNGCFDILHLGHIELLGKARGLGNILIVGRPCPIDDDGVRATYDADALSLRQRWDGWSGAGEQQPLRLRTRIGVDAGQIAIRIRYEIDITAIEYATPKTDKIAIDGS